MHILQVVHGFPPNEWAGTELVTLHLSQALRVRGHEVSVLTRIYDPQRAEGSMHETSYEELPVFQLVNNYTMNTAFRLLYDNPRFNRPFQQLVERLKPDVVHFQHLYNLSVSLLRLTPALGYPTVLSLHDFFFACHRIHLLDAQQQLCVGPEYGARCVSCLADVASGDDARRRFTDMERVLHAPDLVLTPSVFLAEKMRSFFPFLQNRLRAVPLGVQRVAGLNRPRPENTLYLPLRILYVGVLAPHKGAHVLLEAVRELPAQSFSVSLYGTEWNQWHAYAEQLRETAKELPVKFCGTYQHEQFGEILACHDVLVMPMIWEETFSLLTREALLAGVPVIAARRGALVEALEGGVNGLFFEPENASDLRRCLQRLIDDPTLLSRLRQAEPQVKTVEEYAHDIETIYTEIRRVRTQKIMEEKHTTPQTTGDLNNLSESLRAQRSNLGGGGSEARSELSQARSGDSPTVKVSVCIPTYNGSAFLAEAVQSVLAQSFADFELLIVDDGSTDATLDIARSFADPRIVIHRNEKQLGIPGNWNRCLTLAKGEYVCIFHQDDVMLPKNLERKVDVLKADPDIGFIHSAVEFLVEGTMLQPPGSWIEPTVDDFVMDGRRYFRKLLLQGNLICAPSVVARRQCLAEVGMFDEELGYAPDYEMWLKLCVKGKVAFLNQPLLQYRWHEKNASHQYRFSRGIEELQLAARRALRYDETISGRQEEQQILAEVIDSLGVLRQWTATLEQGKEWLEQQRENWQRAANDRDLIIQEQKTWIGELEKAKSWLEEQRVNWQTISVFLAEKMRSFFPFLQNRLRAVPLGVQRVAGLNRPRPENTLY
ncbi:MAG: glycosyltransferase, partial [Deltaproteobacteria bacterium]|nr:glycosyltransferase [Deltaproteobacteria bacterium]